MFILVVIWALSIPMFIVSIVYTFFSFVSKNGKTKKGLSLSLISVVMFFSALIIEDSGNFLIGSFISVLIIILIYRTINKKELKEKEMAIKEAEEMRNLKGPLANGLMTYHGGGLIEESSQIVVEIFETGVEYGNNKAGFYAIDTKDIGEVILDTQSQMSTHVKQRVTATRMVLLGPFALATPKSKTSRVDTTNKFLGIDYNENGNKYTLLLEGEDATKIQLALRKMKNKNNKGENNDTRSNYK